MNNNMMNNQPAVWTVTEVVSLPDDTPVVMRGRITKNMGNNIFVFEDGSGTIMLLFMLLFIFLPEPANAPQTGKIATKANTDIFFIIFLFIICFKC